MTNAPIHPRHKDMAAKAAMEQVKAEPVAWMYERPAKYPYAGIETRTLHARWPDWMRQGWTETPLYAAPQPAAVDGLVALKSGMVAIAAQTLSGDMIDDHEREQADFEGAYNAIIQIARQALAQIERTEDGNPN